jgi:hypothetical protein
MIIVKILFCTIEYNFKNSFMPYEIKAEFVYGKNF